MRRSSALVPALVAAALAIAPAAPAATLQTTSRCYQDNTDVVFNGAGFTPLSVVTVSRDGAPLGSATADAAGAFQRKIRTPELPRGERERVYQLTATDTINTAATNYRATRIFADFSPSRGNLDTLRVRFGVNGFGLAQRDASVYLHYVRPDGEHRATIRLGTAAGTCGVIRRTRQRRLFPFPQTERGRWILQFDTRRTYERATNRRSTPWVRKPVEVFRPRS